MKGKLSSFFKYNKGKDAFKSHKKIIWMAIFIIILILIWSLMAKYVFNKVELSCEDAEQIVLKKMEGGTITECHLSYKKYEIEIIYNNYVYEFEINGNTGEIIKYEGEYEHDIHD